MSLLGPPTPCGCISEFPNTAPHDMTQSTQWLCEGQVTTGPTGTSRPTSLRSSQPAERSNSCLQAPPQWWLGDCFVAWVPSFQLSQ